MRWLGVLTARGDDLCDRLMMLFAEDIVSATPARICLYISAAGAADFGLGKK